MEQPRPLLSPQTQNMQHTFLPYQIVIIVPYLRLYKRYDHRLSSVLHPFDRFFRDYSNARGTEIRNSLEFLSIFFFSIDKLAFTSSVSDIVGIILSASIVMATNGINVGHELGHRKSIIARTCSKILYLPSQYMHFYIEHNFGHHINVATPEDPATARYKQTLYSFWVTSVIRTYISAWKIQLRLLRVSKKSFLSIKNDMIFYTLFQIIFLLFIYYNFGLYPKL